MPNFTVTFEVRQITEVPAETEEEAIQKAWDRVVEEGWWDGIATEELAE